jgi:hypothetical protein
VVRKERRSAKWFLAALGMVLAHEHQIASHVQAGSRQFHGGLEAVTTACGMVNRVGPTNLAVFGFEPLRVRLFHG